jgi:hypothetical protein
MEKIGLLCNPYAGMGKEKINQITVEAHGILKDQVRTIMAGPGIMGAELCPGARVVGSARTGGRQDTMDTALAMAAEGAEMIVIVAGDGTYNDALTGMKEGGRVAPIFGIAAGRFNVIYPKRRHDPFVTLRKLYPFDVRSIRTEPVLGTVARVNGKVVGYGFFQTMVFNCLAYSDASGNLMFVDAAKMLDGQIVPITDFASTSTADTEIKVASKVFGEVLVARGKEISLAMVAQVPDEVNQILCGGFGAISQMMGYLGVVNVFTNPNLALVPTPDFFPIVTKSAGFFEGDQVQYTGVAEGSVIQIDSTPICTIGPKDLLTIEVDRAVGMKAVLPELGR